MVTVNLLPPRQIAEIMVEDVLSSYSLNPGRAVRIRDITLRRFAEKPDLETIYRFIDSLVDGGIRPDDFLRSLRSPDSLPAGSPEPYEILEASERGENIPYCEIVSALRAAMDDETAGVLERVLERASISPSSESPVTRTELDENMGEVASRLTRIRERLDRCGVLTPPRRVGRVSFVKVNLFEVLGRYSSMVTDAVAELIFEAHRRGMSQTAAAEFAGVARDTVGRWWRSAGLKPLHRKHNALAEELAERMVEAYEAHGGNASAAAQAFGVSQSTVLKYWRASGLKPRGRPAALTEAQMARVAKAHGEHGGNASSAARALSLAPSTVRKIWKRAGLDPRQPGRPAGR